MNAVEEIKWYAGPSPRHDSAGLQLRLRREGEMPVALLLELQSSFPDLDAYAAGLLRWGDAPPQELPRLDAVLVVLGLLYREVGGQFPAWQWQRPAADVIELWLPCASLPLARTLLQHATGLVDTLLDPPPFKRGPAAPPEASPAPEAVPEPLAVLDQALAAALDQPEPDDDEDEAPEDMAELLRWKVDEFHERASEYSPGGTPAAAAFGAWRRSIPTYVDLHGHGLRLGQGCKQVLTSHILAEHTGVTGALICNDKALYQTLAERGIPVPRFHVVESPAALGAVVAVLGFPLIVKPSFSTRKIGLTTGISDHEQLRTAFDKAAAKHPAVIVQQEYDYNRYRVLVMGGKVVAVNQNILPVVTGDGVATVRQLVEQMNREPKRNQHGLGFLPGRIRIDRQLHEQLEKQGYTLDDVLPPGVQCTVRRRSGVRGGGIALNHLAETHPDNIAMIERCCRLTGVPDAALDVMSEDIAVSYHHNKTAVIDINARGNVRNNITWEDPAVIGDAMVKSYYPHGTGRIPLVVVLGDGDEGRLADDVAAFLRRCDHVVGRAGVAGAEVDGFRLQYDPERYSTGLEPVWRDPEASAVVMAFSERDWREVGIPWDRCDTLVLARPGVATDPVFRRQLAATSNALVTAAELEGDWPLAATACWHLAADTASAQRLSAAGGNVVAAEAGEGFSRLAWYHDGKEQFEELRYRLGSPRPDQHERLRWSQLALAIGLSAGLDRDRVQQEARSLV